MDFVGKVDNGGPLRHGNHVAFWRKQVNFGGVEVKFKVVEKFEGVGFGVFQVVADAFNPVFQFAFVGADSL